MTLKVRPQLLVADLQGRLLAHPTLKMAGRSGADLVAVNPAELIPLPEGSDLFLMPGRRAWGYDELKGEMVPVSEGPKGQKVTAIAAFMAPAHTAFLLAAYNKEAGAPRLPLFCYTAVGEYQGRYYVPATRVDPDVRQDLKRFDDAEVKRAVKLRCKAEPKNRLVAHLKNCALVNRCPAAKNFFLGRQEAPLPVSPQCNSACVGCLSFQPSKAGFPSTQDRITFVPTADEVAGVALGHLKRAKKKAVVSFGQGCEGDPLMQAGVLEASIRAIRAQAAKGTINLNTNGSRPEEVKKLMAAGLNAIRVSLNSAQRAWYEAYYRPRGYDFDDLKKSLKAVRDAGGWPSINYFVFPGVSDREAELEALSQMIEECGLALIQWRNLNLDPDLYLKTLGDLSGAGKALGVPYLLAEIRRRFPKLRYGYFNPAWRNETQALRSVHT